MSYRKFATFTTLLLGPALLVSACGDDDTRTPTTDAGTDSGPVVVTDAGTDAGPAPMGDLGTCSVPFTVTGEIGRQTVTRNTRDGDPGPLDLGPACGNAEAAVRAPQDVLAYVVPGTTGQTIAVQFSLDNAGTAGDFDTVVQIRGADCTTIPAAAMCFDDAEAGVYQSAGSFAAMAGETVYIVVTGYAEIGDIVDGYFDNGTYSIVLDAGTNEAPTVTSGSVNLAHWWGRIDIVGGDVDGNADIFFARFLDDADALIDLNEDGTADDLDALGVRIGTRLMGMTAFDTGSDVGISDADGSIPERLGAVKAEVRVRDTFGSDSDWVEVPLIYNTQATDGACDVATLQCRTGLACESDVCAVPTALTTACAAAVDITPGTPAAPGTATATVAAGTSNFDAASCSPPFLQQGPEALFAVTVPSGNYDLVLNAGTTTTGTLDTIMYVLSDCTDSFSTVACNDDIDEEAMVYQSALAARDIEAGTYTVVVDLWPNEDGTAMTGDVGLEAYLRPVYGAGHACDDTGVADRCSTGDCASSVCPAAS